MTKKKQKPDPRKIEIKIKITNDIIIILNTYNISSISKLPRQKSLILMENQQMYDFWIFMKKKSKGNICIWMENQKIETKIKNMQLYEKYFLHSYLLAYKYFLDIICQTDYI